MPITNTPFQASGLEVYVREVGTTTNLEED